VVVDEAQPPPAVTDLLGDGPRWRAAHGHHEVSTNRRGRVAAAAPARWTIGVAVRRWSTASDREYGAAFGRDRCGRPAAGV